MLAITDHDTVAAHYHLSSCLPADGPELITGIELSTTWMKRSIHIVGLNFPLQHPDLTALVRQQSEARKQRADYICERLAKALCKTRPGITPEVVMSGAMAQAKKAQQSTDNTFRQPDNMIRLGRPHFARWLKEEGIINEMQDAFDHFLNNKNLGRLHTFWMPMAKGIAWLRALGATVVLAHPGKYRLTRTKLIQLITEFQQAGGHAMEVASGNQNLEQMLEIADFCRRFHLMASRGSDFHSPSPWTELGKMPPLPEDLIPVWNHWSATPI